MVNYSNVLIFTTALHFYCIRKAAGILYHVEHIVFWTLLHLLVNIFQRFAIEFSLFRLNFLMFNICIVKLLNLYIFPL